MISFNTRIFYVKFKIQQNVQVYCLKLEIKYIQTAASGTDL